MRIWAIGDLHLGFGVQNKSMDLFGPQWRNHAEQIASHWRSMIEPDHLVLIPGDISWAMRIEDALPDLAWIHQLPGTKVMIKGNHDFWWGSLKKVSAALPPSIHLIQNNAFHWREAAIGGARLWDTPEYGFGKYIAFQENPHARPADAEAVVQEELSQKIFDRELERLKMSLSELRSDAAIRIAMTHYPPIGAEMQSSRAAQVLEQHGIQTAVFGHLHNIKPDLSLFGKKNGVTYLLASCDYIRFRPIAIV